ncbi:MAG: polysaccharide deacetylase family protein [Candidatus Omnitrophota bacterium]
MKYQRKFFNTQSVEKTFVFKDKIFSERVAKYPKAIYMPGCLLPEPNVGNFYPENKDNIFSLRIDVDALEENDFREYIKILEPYKKWVTLFCCVSAFAKKDYLLKEIALAGFDIQSHGFLHHAYNDYANNYNNISKAKDYFSKAGINTFGFAAPMGKYNESLMLALENLGYTYSSDFSFDYLNFPHYPKLKKRFSKILQVPIFPICPELLFLNDFKLEEVTAYYDSIVENLVDSRIPVITYNHTDARYPQIKDFLKQFLAKIAGNDKLYKCNVSDFSLWCLRGEDKSFSGSTGILNERVAAGFLKIPDSSLFGKPKKLCPAKRIKKAIENAIDFETITPPEEIKGSKIRKGVKLFIRKIKTKSNQF